MDASERQRPSAGIKGCRITIFDVFEKSSAPKLLEKLTPVFGSPRSTQSEGSPGPATTYEWDPRELGGFLKVALDLFKERSPKLEPAELQERVKKVNLHLSTSEILPFDVLTLRVDLDPESLGPPRQLKFNLAQIYDPFRAFFVTLDGLSKVDGSVTGRIPVITTLSSEMDKVELSALVERVAMLRARPPAMADGALWNVRLEVADGGVSASEPFELDAPGRAAYHSYVILAQNVLAVIGDAGFIGMPLMRSPYFLFLTDSIASGMGLPIGDSPALFIPSEPWMLMFNLSDVPVLPLSFTIWLRSLRQELDRIQLGILNARRDAQRAGNGSNTGTATDFMERLSPLLEKSSLCLTTLNLVRIRFGEAIDRWARKDFGPYTETSVLSQGRLTNYMLEVRRELSALIAMASDIVEDAERGVATARSLMNLRSALSLERLTVVLVLLTTVMAIASVATILLLLEQLHVQLP